MTNSSSPTTLVTGGTAGIGLALTRQLLERGHRVIVVGRRPEALAEVKAMAPDRVFTFTVDLSDIAAVRQAGARIAQEHPELSMIINNAGIQFYADAVSDDRETLVRDAEIEITTNITAPITLILTLLPTLQAHGKARVVNITSALAIWPKKNSPLYSATKAALRSYTIGLRYQCEAGAPHVGVTEVIMTLVDTAMTAGRDQYKISADKAALSVLRGLDRELDEIWVDRTVFLKWVNLWLPGLVRRMLRKV